MKQTKTLLKTLPCTCLGLLLSNQSWSLLLLHSHEPKDLLCFTLGEVSSDHKYGVTCTK